MSKRGRQTGGSVTGGTGDIKPQQLTFSGTQAVVNEYLVLPISLPVPRFGLSSKKATIFEILKVMMYFGSEDSLDLSHTLFGHLATNDLGRLTGGTSSLASNQQDLAESNTIASAVMNHSGVTSGFRTTIYPIVIDLTDNNGNGVLVATDKLVYVFGSAQATVLSTFAVKVLYRMVNVGVEEYVGIVQSQLQ